MTDEARSNHQRKPQHDRARLARAIGVMLYQRGPLRQNEMTDAVLAHYEEIVCNREGEEQCAVMADLKGLAWTAVRNDVYHFYERCGLSKSDRAEPVAELVMLVDKIRVLRRMIDEHNLTASTPQQAYHLLRAAGVDLSGYGYTFSEQDFDITG